MESIGGSSGTTAAAAMPSPSVVADGSKGKCLVVCMRWSVCLYVSHAYLILFVVIMCVDLFKARQFIEVVN